MQYDPRDIYKKLMSGVASLGAVADNSGGYGQASNSTYTPPGTSPPDTDPSGHDQNPSGSGMGSGSEAERLWSILAGWHPGDWMTANKDTIINNLIPYIQANMEGFWNPTRVASMLDASNPDTHSLIELKKILAGSLGIKPRYVKNGSEMYVPGYS